MTEDEQVALIKNLWGVKKEPPELMCLVRLRQLMYTVSYAFELSGTLKTVALMGANDMLLTEADRLNRSLRCEVGNLFQ